MDEISKAPQLSIVVPLLNEENLLPGFLSRLGRQQGVDFELILCDGGSSDRSKEIAEAFFREAQMPGSLVCAPRGRASQLNAGASRAGAEVLLFLHVDTLFEDDRTLGRAFEALVQRHRLCGHDRVAGHFPLKFIRSRPESERAGYYYHEAKTRLDRPGCTHGDQGFMMTSRFFNELGRFNTQAPVLEDTLLAEAVRARGGWMLLPGLVHTSARRFEAEGLAERQTLNALIMNFSAIGWNAFSDEALGLYREQKATARLTLFPFFDLVRKLLSCLSIGQRWHLWYETGRYVRTQGWQLAFALDCRLAMWRELAPAEMELRATGIWDRFLDPLTDNRAGRGLSAMLVRCWFQWKMCRLERKEERNRETT